MADDKGAQALTFTYRLPVTYVRIIGQRVRTNDELHPPEVTTFESAVTAEVAADPTTAIRVTISPGYLATKKATWNLLPDGRLTGSDVTTTVDAMAHRRSLLETGLFAAGAAAKMLPLALPLLAVTGPPGWALGLGLAAVTGGVAAAAASTTFGGVSPDADSAADKQAADDAAAEEASTRLAVFGVHQRYAQEHEFQARLLGDYRCAIAQAEKAHAALALTAGADPNSARAKLHDLDAALRSVRMAAASYEAAYAQWLESKRTITRTAVDERRRIDYFPTEEQLRSWAAGGSGSSSWSGLAESLRLAVSVDIDRLAEEERPDVTQPGSEYRPLLDDRLAYRQPRPVTLKTWKLTPVAASENGPKYNLEQDAIVRMQAAYPGNERTIPLASSDETSSAVAVTFEENGALTKISTEVTDRALQRSQELSALPAALSAAATAGSDIGAKFAPPSLADQVTEAEAAAKLGLVPSPADPLQAMKAQVEEERLRAQLKIAQQITSSNTPISIVVQTEVGSA